MAGKNIIARIAFGIAIAAFLFSVVTLIRMIVIGSGWLWFGIIQVTGTMLIVGICFILLRVVGTDKEIEEDESAEKDEDEISGLGEEIPSGSDTDSDKDIDIDLKYDLSHFE